MSKLAEILGVRDGQEFITRIVIFILVLMAIILICKVTGISDMPPQDDMGMVLPGEILGGRG